jgi:hypothetical protein
MFLIDIPFKGCQGRPNHSSIVHAVSYFACSVNGTAFVVHAVSMTPCAHVHVVSMTLRAFLIILHTIAVLHMIFTFRSCSTILLCTRCQWHRMRCQWYRMHRPWGVNDTACILKIRISSRIRIYIRKGFNPLSGAQDGCLIKKNRGSKISWQCPFNTKTNDDWWYNKMTTYVCQILFIAKRENFWNSLTFFCGTKVVPPRPVYTRGNC